MHIPDEMVSKHTQCVAHVALKPVGCWHRGGHTQGACAHRHVLHSKCSVKRWGFNICPFKSPFGFLAGPGGARGPPSERLPMAPQPVGHSGRDRPFIQRLGEAHTPGLRGN